MDIILIFLTINGGAKGGDHGAAGRAEREGLNGRRGAERGDGGDVKIKLCGGDVGDVGGRCWRCLFVKCGWRCGGEEGRG